VADWPREAGPGCCRGRRRRWTSGRGVARGGGARRTSTPGRAVRDTWRRASGAGGSGVSVARAGLVAGLWGRASASRVWWIRSSGAPSGRVGTPRLARRTGAGRPLSCPRCSVDRRSPGRGSIQGSPSPGGNESAAWDWDGATRQPEIRFSPPLSFGWWHRAVCVAPRLIA